MVVKTVVEAQDIFDKAWEGFKGELERKSKCISLCSSQLYTI